MGTCFVSFSVPVLIQITGHFILSNVPAVTQQHLCLVKQQRCWSLAVHTVGDQPRICLLIRGLQLTCVGIWVKRLNFSEVTETISSYKSFVDWCLQHELLG